MLNSKNYKKWYKKALLFGVDAVIINAKIICDIRYGKETTTLYFKERIIKYIFEKYKKLVSNDCNNINEENKIINNKNEDNYIIPSIRQKIHNIVHTINKQKSVNFVGIKHHILAKNVAYIYILNAFVNIIIIMFITKNN